MPEIVFCDNEERIMAILLVYDVGDSPIAIFVGFLDFNDMLLYRDELELYFSLIHLIWQMMKQIGCKKMKKG